MMLDSDEACRLDVFVLYASQGRRIFGVAADNMDIRKQVLDENWSTAGSMCSLLNDSEPVSTASVLGWVRLTCKRHSVAPVEICVKSQTCVVKVLAIVWTDILRIPLKQLSHIANNERNHGIYRHHQIYHLTLNADRNSLAQIAENDGFSKLRNGRSSCLPFSMKYAGLR